MIFAVNIAVMIATIIFGLIGWLMPKLAMQKLGLKTDNTNMGYTEIRAANGALFVAAGGGAILISLPVAFAMVGFMYLGAAIGRITGIIVDNAGSVRSWSYFSIESVLAAYLLIANLVF